MNKLIICGNSADVIDSDAVRDFIGDRDAVIVTDPPFNIGYHYRRYKDRLPDSEYWSLLKQIVSKYDKRVVIHYPERLHRLSIETGNVPEKIVAWVYNSNLSRQHRDVAFYGFKPDFSLVKQRYKNTNDKRIQKLIRGGSIGTNLYDWWNVQQVKNVSKEKTKHSCQMPLKVMENIIGIIPNKENTVVIDPFAGSGTTGIACLKYDVDFIGVDIDPDYVAIINERFEQAEKERGDL